MNLKCLVWPIRGKVLELYCAGFSCVYITMPEPMSVCACGCVCCYAYAHVWHVIG